MRCFRIVAVAVALLFTISTLAQQHPASQAKANPGLEKMKSLVGDWEGSANEGGQTFPVAAKITVVSGGSVVMQDLAPGTDHEMITMIHADGADLLATHYCSAHNQPRMKLVPSKDANALLFDFKDGTNIGPNDGHMQSVKFIFVDDNTHYEDWSYIDHGKVSTRRFEFHRRKA